LFYLEWVTNDNGREDHHSILLTDYEQVREELAAGNWRRFVISELGSGPNM
jgi:hypothetical protein